MRSTWLHAIACAALTVTGGCQGEKATAKKPVDAQAALERVEAALQIVGHNEKDEALATSCRDAAGIGAHEAVMKGLPSIVSHILRDQVAEDCALKLRDSGQGSAAAEVARLIVSHIKRDEVLKRLASGS